MIFQQSQHTLIAITFSNFNKTYLFIIHIEHILL